MKALDVRTRQNPERKLQNKIIAFLEQKGWFVKSTHGSMFQAGFPDLYATHKWYGPRWIEVKLPSRRGDVFTNAQKATFPKLCANGAGVWVMVDASEKEYKKLFATDIKGKLKYNWWTYLNTMSPKRRG